MPLLGQALVGIWHGVQPGHEDEYQAWHTHEHMPERLGVPGFLRGRRFTDWSLEPHPTFTLYEGAHLETFRSPGYLARLNDPTAWSNRVQPTMTSFLRGGCEVLLTVGQGVGGGMATVRLAAPDGDRARFEGDLAAAALRLRALPGVTAVHVARHEAAATGGETAETRMRPSVHPATFSHLVLVEGLGPAVLTRADADMRAILAGAGARDIASNAYALEFELLSPMR
ncbi:hypothetical protein [Alsobacter sp. SYSU BS001988]